MITHTRINTARTIEQTIVETHRRRAAVLANVLQHIVASTGSAAHCSALHWNTTTGMIVSHMASGAQELLAGPRPDEWAHRAAWLAKSAQARRMGSELYVTFTAEIDGETVSTSVRCRAQAKRNALGNYIPNNKLVLWYGKHDRRRGYGDETRVVEGAAGLNCDDLARAVIAKLTASVAMVRHARELSEARRLEREARQQRMREDRERREANRAELETIRSEAAMQLGLANVNITADHNGTYSVSYTRSGAASSPAELRTLLAQLASVLAPPPPAMPENDPDEDDDFNWRPVVAASA